MIRHDLEIVTHCFARVHPFYRAQLQYQVASLFHYCPPNINVCLSVCTTNSDRDTIEYCRLAEHRLPPYIRLNLVQLQPGFLYRRAIGRNLRALVGEAAVFWFADVDYMFGPNCITSLLNRVDQTSGLVFPKIVRINKTHADGDALTDGMTPQVQMFPHTDFKTFVARRQKTCIGGIHIIGRDRLLETNPATGHPYGYINRHKKCRPVDPDAGFRQCRCDVPFKSQHQPATPIDIQGVYRIRHTDAGRCFDAQGNRTVVRPEGKLHD